MGIRLRDCITDWLDDKTRTEGCSAKNIEYMRSLKERDAELSRVGVLTFFLLTRLGLSDARTMMLSAKRQRAFVYKVISELKKYRVDKRHENGFEHDLEGLKRRCEHVYMICREDLRLTEHWLYFEQVGFEKLLDFRTSYEGKDTSVLDELIPAMEMWEDNHRDEIEQYMESIKDELEAIKVHKLKVKEKEKAEKAKAKAAKKAEDAEVKEIQMNRKRDAERRRKLERELETTMRHVGFLDDKYGIEGVE